MYVPVIWVILVRGHAITRTNDLQVEPKHQIW